MGKFLQMGKFINGAVSRAPGPGVASSPPNPPFSPPGGPRARGLGAGPIYELAHLQELAHSNLAGVGWGGLQVDLHVQVVQSRSTRGMAQAALKEQFSDLLNC